MTPFEAMICLIASMSHDLDHPGVNQTFLIHTANHLAKLYQVRSHGYKVCVNLKTKFGWGCSRHWEKHSIVSGEIIRNEDRRIMNYYFLVITAWYFWTFPILFNVASVDLL